MTIMSLDGMYSSYDCLFDTAISLFDLTAVDGFEQKDKARLYKFQSWLIIHGIPFNPCFSIVSEIHSFKERV